MPFDPITAVATTVDTVVSRIWPDATESEKAKLAMISQELDAELQVKLGQLEINKVEAASTNWFVSGARPFILWICGFSIAYSAIIYPLLSWVAVVCFGYTGAIPRIDNQIVETALYGLLSIGGLRTVEKIKGVARN